MWFRLRYVCRVALAVALGGRCAGCGGRHLRALCDACEQELHRIPMAPAAALRDEGVAGRLVRRAKHGQWRAAADVIGPIVVERLRHSLAGTRVDLVTWVPADPVRRRIRGGHFPERLARVVARSLGVPARPLLERQRSRAQRGLDAHTRATNVRGMFRALDAPDMPRVVQAPVVVLIDDVCTTGATLGEAAGVLAMSWYRPIPFAAVGVPLRMSEPVSTVRAAVGVECLMAEATTAGKPHDARNSRSGTGVGMPIYRLPREEREPPFVSAEPRPP